MKILHFLQWQWRQFDAWQKWWMVGMFFFGAGVGASDPYQRYLLAIPFLIITLSLLKWILWDGIKHQWAQFNQEQQKIVDIMKGTE